MAKQFNFYQLLNVSSQASPREIDNAYNKKLGVQTSQPLHPRFKDLPVAYLVLRYKKAAHDKGLAPARRSSERRPAEGKYRMVKYKN